MATLGTGYAPTVGVSITIEPSPIIIAKDFRDFALGIRSFREPLKRSIQGILGPSFVRNFEVGGRPTWAPLSESRLQQKQRLGLQLDILIATGKLKKISGQLNIWTIQGGYLSGDASAFVSSLPGAEYGVYHTSGTKDMPARPFLVIQPEDEDEIENVFRVYIAERWARAHGVLV